MGEELRVIIGRRLRSFREECKLTREQFAEEVGISPQFLAELEGGKKGMSVETLYKICTRFELSADYLVLGKFGSELAAPINGLFKDMPGEYTEEYMNLLKAVSKLAKVGRENRGK